MKKISVLIIFLLGCLGSSAQSITGAWERNFTNENGEEIKTVTVYTDGYYVFTTYEAKTGKFINTKGGSFSLSENTITEKTEFNTESPDEVGTENSFDISVSDAVFKILDTDLQFKRIDAGQPGKLQGAWLMSGRVVDGKSQQRATDVPRKTMKILSGTRFQWIAYNTETKQFMGTGGGTYTTENGVYIENIEFFSRDNSRVGASLDFKFKLENGDWHHSGLSSKGAPINEIWSLRE